MKPRCCLALQSCKVRALICSSLAGCTGQLVVHLIFPVCQLKQDCRTVSPLYCRPSTTTIRSFAAFLFETSCIDFCRHHATLAVVSGTHRYLVMRFTERHEPHLEQKKAGQGKQHCRNSLVSYTAKSDNRSSVHAAQYAVDCLPLSAHAEEQQLPVRDS